MLYLRSFKGFILTSLAFLLGFSFFGQASAVSVVHNGLLDGTDDLPYFDSALGTLTSVAVEAQFNVDILYSAECTSSQDTCEASILMNLTNGVVDGPIDLFTAPDSLSHSELVTVDPPGAAAGFANSVTSTFYAQEVFTGTQADLFKGIGLFGYIAFSNLNCIPSGEAYQASCSVVSIYDDMVNVVYEYIAPSAVPVPAAVWLFGTALVGLIGFGGRKTRIAA